MQGLIDALYRYAQENLVGAHLQTLEYHRPLHGLENEWDIFRSTLIAEQGRSPDALLSRETETRHLEEEAVFCSGVSIGLDLSRL
ncbi:MAG: hypothetical protein OSJ58_00065 [Dysosmobacter sp.]|nr:hypothetical protein [Dysosmobacter sp.]